MTQSQQSSKSRVPLQPYNGSNPRLFHPGQHRLDPMTSRIHSRNGNEDASRLRKVRLICHTLNEKQRNQLN